MNKKLNIFLILLIFLLLFFSFIRIDILKYSLIEGSLIFIKNVFPFIFIMIIINTLLIKLNFPYFLKKLFKNEVIYIFIMSFLSGSPSNAIIIKEYLDNGFINDKTASILISFTNFANPLFLLFYFKRLFNSPLKVLFFIVYFIIANIIFYLLHKNKIMINSVLQTKKVIFSEVLLSSINNAINKIISIYGIYIFFKLITDIVIVNNSQISVLCKGFIEITQGLNALSLLNTPLIKKEIISLLIISFMGLSVHMQIQNILKDYNINYKYFYLNKIILMCLSLLVGLI